ncbi:MAG TPA: HAMP domain-containing sensor histidine kinase [Candidatus Limnocylindrales bacterium]|nr:HAMP domain-containing sensor histidine kinase [Candidatus Limnocylindrales bacterium]
MNLTVRTRLALWFGTLFVAGGAVIVAGMVYSAQKYMFADYSLSSEDLAAEQAAMANDGDAAAKMRAGERLEAQRARLRADATRHLVEDAAVGLLVVTVMAGVVGAVMSGRLLRRVRRVTEAAKVASDANLGLRLNLPGPRDEIKELADTFDAMLTRLEAGIQAQRRFVANASHELRTPLAVARTAAEVTLAKPHATVEQLREMGEQARTAMIRAQRLVDSLLVLARSDQDLGPGEVDDLADLVAEAVDQVAPLARAEGVRVRTELGPAPVSGDVALLGRAVANLVENAVRHNRPEGEVVAATGMRNGRVWVRVTNTGQDLSTMDVQRLFEPFHRGDRTRLDSRAGAGLGLSIVAAVVRAHGGTVSASSRDPAGGGLVVTLELPAHL